MFTRIVELTAKQGKSKELCKAIYEKVLPILKKHNGFVELTTLVSETDPNRVLGLSNWKDREDAERYRREDYPKVLEILKNLSEREPTVGTYNVETSTSHRIVSNKAA
jgi:quinol monooxygenase YgiN